MIYYHYPTYYRAPTSFNRKYASLSNNTASNLNNSISYTRFPYNNVNKHPKSSQTNTQKNIQENTKEANFKNCESMSETTRSQKKSPHILNEESLFEIFGIKLYFDDILLVCLIFFLYDEGVKDQYLFIALVLLLLS